MCPPHSDVVQPTLCSLQAILPVGDMPDDVFASYASLVTAFRQVSPAPNSELLPGRATGLCSAQMLHLALHRHSNSALRRSCP